MPLLAVKQSLRTIMRNQILLDLDPQATIMMVDRPNLVEDTVSFSLLQCLSLGTSAYDLPFNKLSA